MKTLKFQKPESRLENLVVTMLWWYVIGSVSILIVLIGIEWMLH